MNSRLHHLDLIAAAPDGVKRLRELILELAVRGKLVPQDPNDEPASELLKRIQAEKARLVAEGKIKNDKSLPVIGEEEKPFELPAGWEWVRLASLAGFENGDRSKNYPSRDHFVAHGIPFINAGHLQNRKIDFADMNFISAERFEMLRAGKVQQGDVLFCLRGSLGKFAVVPTIGDAAIASSLVIVRVASKDFLPYVLEYFTSPLISILIARFDNGTAQPNLAANDLAKFLLPLPPLPEQNRIVAKVGELMALCDRLEAQQTEDHEAHATLVKTLLDTLTQPNPPPGSAVSRPDRFMKSVRSRADADSAPPAPDESAAGSANSCSRVAAHFDTLFTTEASIDALKQTILQLAVMGKLVPQDPNDEPASELLKRIQAEKARLVAEGKLRKDKPLPAIGGEEKPFELPEGWEWSRLDDLLQITGGVTLGRKLQGRRLVSAPYLRVANVQRGYLVLDVIKNVEVPVEDITKYQLQQADLLITEGGDWDKVGRTAIWNSEIAQCLHQNHVFRARKLVDDWNVRWTEMYLNSHAAREYFAGSSKQTTNLASINMTQLRGCSFPVPPLPEQHRIVAKVDELMALCDQLASQLKSAREVSGRYASAATTAALNAA